jgi:hypothetical protein
MRNLISFLMILVFIQTVQSQDVVFNENVNSDSVIETHGPNLKHFKHPYIGFGFAAMQSEDKRSNVDLGLSSNFVFGYRYKLKLSNFYAIGYDINYNQSWYRLSQTTDKRTPDSLLNDKERLTFQNFEIGLYNRFNFGKRGNIIGKFIDLGAYADWTFQCTHFFQNKIDGNIYKTEVTRLKYYEPVNYGVLARIGINRWVVYANYRLSDLFKSAYNYAELPRLTVGFQVGLHK